MGLSGGNRVDRKCRLLRVCTSARAIVGSESRCVAHREGGGVMDLSILKVIEDIETYLKSALASPKPSASANTASLEAAPKSLSANIARYRSNKGDLVFKSAFLKSGIDWGRDEGAGSIVGKSGLVVSTSDRVSCSLPAHRSQAKTTDWCPP